jgi:hypothetical protein
MHFSLNSIIQDKAFRIKFMLSSLVLLMLTMISGCAIERNVKDNRFYSSFPKMTVEVNKKFDYLGSGKYQTSGYLNMEHEYFVFSGKTDKQTIQKGIVLEVAMTLTKHHPYAVQYYLNIDDKAKNVFVHNYKTIDGNKYEYYTSCSAGIGSSKMAQWLNQKGYLYPRCILQQWIVDLGTDSHREILYFEDATLSGLDCFGWQDKNKLTERQKQYIAEFTVRADEATKYIDF